MTFLLAIFLDWVITFCKLFYFLNNLFNFCYLFFFFIVLIHSIVNDVLF